MCDTHCIGWYLTVAFYTYVAYVNIPGDAIQRPGVDCFTDHDQSPILTLGSHLLGQYFRPYQPDPFENAAGSLNFSCCPIIIHNPIIPVGFSGWRAQLLLSPRGPERRSRL